MSLVDSLTYFRCGIVVLVVKYISSVLPFVINGMAIRFITQAQNTVPPTCDILMYLLCLYVY